MIERFVAASVRTEEATSGYAVDKEACLHRLHAGKTYTMEGVQDHPAERGIIPRAIEHIFQHIQENEDPCIKYIVRGSYLQIYNDTVMDMLQPGRSLTIRESARRGVYVQGIR